MPLGVEENGVRSCVPFLFIDQREGWDTIRSYLVTDNLKLDHVLLNPSMQISRDYGSMGLSITLFLRADGTLASLHIGEILREALNAKIVKLTGST